MNELTIAWALIALGVVLIGGELLLPTGGILLGFGCAAMVGGIMVGFLHDSYTGLYMLIGVCLAFPALGTLLLYLWPRSPMGRRLMREGDRVDDTLAASPAALELENLRGRYGKTISAMRPSGLVDFDGRRVDAMTEGMMLEPGQTVRCIEVKPGGRVIVRAVDQPKLEDLETTDL